MDRIAILLVGWFLGLFSKELQDWITRFVRGPKLSLEFDGGEDCITLTPESYRPTGDVSMEAKLRQREVFFARLRVTNVKPRLAQGCRAYLINVEEVVDEVSKATIFSDSVPLVWSYNTEVSSVDLPKDVKQYVDVVRIQNDLDEFQPQLRGHDGTVFSILRYAPIFKRLGTLRFTVLVSADQLSPETLSIDVTWNGEWPPKANAS